ncbi:metallophosphoesterase [Microbulbifer sp. 2205BS26-8]|uniref:metallophosphoesterase n=1 Tax=Microbulbifer sp. 2205BS26-8 TaxID=3064386 RepID=UPI00273F1A9B|nr:metallophosphoesterase [Microbulbifer sp. 2205BS26-8]MDP5211000.1 metallophosphoesterase [Microbulbifer sp. 2205BS26-8]
MGKLRITSTIFFVIGLTLAIWAFFAEPNSFRIREQAISIDSWPSACNNKKVAILADLHVGSPYKGIDSLRWIVDKVNARLPDLILLPGDFVIQGVAGGSFVAPEEAARVLGELKAPMGVFAVLGNHDWWLDAKRVEKAFADRGITVLEDRSAKLSNGACELRLVGISDYWEGAHDITKAMDGIDTAETILAFTHNPDIFPELPKQITLTIAGHTHGGQVYLPFIGRPVVPSRYGQRYAIGHVIEEGKNMYVSPGVGTSILPVRFLVPPEVTLLSISNG